MEFSAQNNQRNGGFSFIVIILFLGFFVISGILFYNLLFLGQTLKANVKPQKPQNMYSIGVLQDSENLQIAYDGFIEGLKAEGLEEHKNLKIEHTIITADQKKAQEAFSQYVHDGVDLVVTIGSTATITAKKVNKDHKNVVFFIVGDPIGNGIIDSYQSPGGDFTGIDSAQNRSAPRRLALLKEIAPKITKVLFFYNNPNNNGIDDLRLEAQKENITLVERKVVSVQDFDDQVSKLNPKDFDAIFRAADSIAAARLNKLIDLSLQYKVPFSGTQWGDTEGGGLISYGPDYASIGKQASVIAKNVLYGIKPSQIPVEQPERQVISINLKTAEKLGLTVPDELLGKAEKVIH